MTTAFTVLHFKSHVNIPDGLVRHLTRKQIVMIDGHPVAERWVPDNADSDKTDDNVDLLNLSMSPQRAVTERLKEAKIKQRNGQASCVECIMSGSPEVMGAMSRDEVIRWANDSLTWAQMTYGIKNVVAAYLHLDEKTPHIHLILVPIVEGLSPRTIRHRERMAQLGHVVNAYKNKDNRYRLSASEVLDRNKMYGYHDDYASKVGEQYGLHRGVRAEPGSKKRHTTSEEHNRQLEREAMETRELIAELTQEYNNLQEDVNKAKKDKRREGLKNAVADIGARALNKVGRGAVAEANKERDDALRRAEEADHQRAEAMRLAQFAESARRSAEAAAKKAKQEKEEYARQAARRAYAEGKAEGAKQMDELRNEISKLSLQMLNEQEKNKALNQGIKNMLYLAPQLKNWGNNYKQMKDAGISDKEIRDLFRYGGKKGVEIPIIRHGVKHIFTANVALAESTKGEMLVWFNGVPFSSFINNCKSQLEEPEEEQSYGMHM